MSIITVRDAIYEGLQAMQSFKGVADYESSNSTGAYPFGTLTVRDGDGTFESNQHNLRRRGFRIRVYQEQSKIGQGPDNAEEIIVRVIDEVERYFDTNTTLSGTCQYAFPVAFNAGYVDRELDSRILEIDIDAYEVVTSANGC